MVIEQLEKHGTLAQMVEQWTENPCVPGSIPGGTTKPKQQCLGFLFLQKFKKFNYPLYN